MSVLPFCKRRCRWLHIYIDELDCVAQWAGEQVSRASEWAELQASCYGNGKIERDSIWPVPRQRQTYGNEERYFFA